MLPLLETEAPGLAVKTAGTLAHRLAAESQHSYICGLDAALELRSHYEGVGNNVTQQMYVVHDGHGSVRATSDRRSLNCGINYLPFLGVFYDSVANSSWVWVLIYRAHSSGPPHSALHTLNPVLS